MSLWMCARKFVWSTTGTAHIPCAKNNLFVHHFLFYGVPLLTTNLRLWLPVGLGLVIVLELFSCCLLSRLRHFLVTVRGRTKKKALGGRHRKRRELDAVYYIGPQPQWGGGAPRSPSNSSSDYSSFLNYSLVETNGAIWCTFTASCVHSQMM